jgi:Flp pilus assembly protein TadB
MPEQIPHVLLYAVAGGLSVFTFCLYFYSLYYEYRAHQAGREAAIDEDGASGLFRTVKPIASFFGHLISSVLNRLQRRYGDGGMMRYVNNLRIKIQRLLASAGNPEGLTADEMLGVVCLSVLAWTGLGVAFWAVTGLSFPIMLAFVVGWLHPYLWLRKRITARRNEVRRLLPYALDLLTLSVEAGLDFTAALDRMLPKLGDSALADEFGETLRKIRLGRPRAEALREMADRVNMPEVTAFCSSLLQADELGADLGPVLRVLSDQTREQRANRAEKKAMEAPVKILFPLIAFIFPTVFIILFAPIGIGYLNEIFGW